MSEAVEHLLQAALALPGDQQLQLLAAFHSAMEERGLRSFADG